MVNPSNAEISENQAVLKARYFIQSPHRIEQLVAEHLHETDWEEIFLLAAGLVDSADGLLQLMAQQAQTYLNTPQLKYMVAWASQITIGSPADETPYVKWLLALSIGCTRSRSRFIIINSSRARVGTIASDIAKTRAKDSANIIDSAIDIAKTSDSDRARASDRANIRARASASAIARTRASASLKETRRAQIFSPYKADLDRGIQELEDLRNIIPSSDASYEEVVTFCQKIPDILLRAIKLDPKQVDFSFAEDKSLARYIRTTDLIIRCKESTVCVSPKNWDEIESQLLLPEGM